MIMGVWEFKGVGSREQSDRRDYGSSCFAHARCWIFLQSETLILTMTVGLSWIAFWLEWEGTFGEQSRFDIDRV